MRRLKKSKQGKWVVVFVIFVYSLALNLCESEALSIDTGHKASPHLLDTKIHSEDGSSDSHNHDDEQQGKILCCSSLLAIPLTKDIRGVSEFRKVCYASHGGLVNVDDTSTNLQVTFGKHWFNLKSPPLWTFQFYKLFFPTHAPPFRH